jgi:hypothetical protein
VKGEPAHFLRDEVLGADGVDPRAHLLTWHASWPGGNHVILQRQPPIQSFSTPGRDCTERARTDDQALVSGKQTNAVPGYGPTEWFQNVALAAASEDDLARLVDTELHRQMDSTDAPLATESVGPQEQVIGADLLGMLSGASTFEQ